jgi:DNA-binding NtrC family response regulator
MIAVPQAKTSAMGGNNMPVTLVEPDEAVRSALTTLLEGRGWKVLALDSGERLGNSLHEGTPVAVVCESTLPDMTAVNVLDECRRYRVPVVFLGHQTQVQNAVDLVRMGARDFLEKPFPQDRLLSLLENLAREKVYV